ncbi:MAG: hypothetical protein CMI27_02725 [Opitutae bacterium]|nr:hypothetical protein [Opitutae bacterium]
MYHVERICQVSECHNAVRVEPRKTAGLLNGIIEGFDQMLHKWKCLIQVFKMNVDRLLLCLLDKERWHPLHLKGIGEPLNVARGQVGGVDCDHLLSLLL